MTDIWKRRRGNQLLLLVEIKTAIQFLKNPLMLVNENYRVPDDTKSFFFSPKTEAYTYSYRFNILVSLDSGDLNIS